jgi:hypothetical protein
MCSILIQPAYLTVCKAMANNFPADSGIRPGEGHAGTKKGHADPSACPFCLCVVRISVTLNDG